MSTNPPPTGRQHKAWPWVLAMGALALVAIVVGVASVKPGAGTAARASSSAVATYAPATYAPAATPTLCNGSCASPAMTAGQQQAVESAQGYLSEGQGFSKAGLMQQLTSHYGEGFSKADARFAIRYLHPNWYQQAVKSARNYLNDGQGFSRDGLIQQLSSSYGEGFTYAQAVYAVNKVGL